MKLSQEKIAEMLAAAEKATPGRWFASEDDDGDEIVSHIVRPVRIASNNVEYLDVLPRIEFPLIGKGGSAQGSEQNAFDAAYVALCNPPAITAILTELLALRSQADALSGESGTDDADEMEKISKLIARLQDIHDRFGDTCVYIRRGGLSWGAVALNRQSDDREHGIFDLQATHDREMTERLEQVERLIADRNEWRQRAWTAEAAIGGPGK